MRTAEIIWKEECVLWETTSGGSLEDHIRHAINKSRVELITEIANTAKTYKVGNSGSWYDAAVDKDSILKLIKEIE